MKTLPSFIHGLFVNFRSWTAEFVEPTDYPQFFTVVAWNDSIVGVNTKSTETLIRTGGMRVDGGTVRRCFEDIKSGVSEDLTPLFCPISFDSPTVPIEVPFVAFGRERQPGYGAGLPGNPVENETSEDVAPLRLLAGVDGPTPYYTVTPRVLLDTRPSVAWIEKHNEKVNLLCLLSDERSCRVIPTDYRPDQLVAGPTWCDKRELCLLVKEAESDALDLVLVSMADTNTDVQRRRIIVHLPAKPRNILVFQVARVGLSHVIRIDSSLDNDLYEFADCLLYLRHTGEVERINCQDRIRYLSPSGTHVSCEEDSEYALTHWICKLDIETLSLTRVLVVIGDPSLSGWDQTERFYVSAFHVFPRWTRLCVHMYDLESKRKLRRLSIDRYPTDDPAVMVGSNSELIRD